MRFLELVSLIYLATPYFIFSAGWLNPTAAFVLCTLLAAGLWPVYRENQENTLRSNSELRGTPVVIILGLSLLWVYGSGVGGFAHQNTDYMKHNAVLGDLIDQTWPIRYTREAAGSPLVYYIAYYLPAALAGKVWGWEIANFIQYFWTVLGVFLAILGFCRLVPRRPLLASTVFILCSGLDYLGRFILSGKLFRATEHAEWWSGYWQYSSNTTLLFWAPQHGIAGWITGTLLLSSWLQRRSSTHSGFVIALSVLWSPWVTLGLLPYGLLAAVRTRAKGLFTFANTVIAPIVAITVFLFYLSLTGNVPRGWIWEYGSPLVLIPVLIVFYLIEFGLFQFFVARFSHATTRDDLWLKAVSLTCLLLIPIYRVGEGNDFAMRVSIPSLLMIWLILADSLTQMPSSASQIKRRKVLIALLFIAALTPFNEMIRAVSPQAPPALRTSVPKIYLAEQYLGREDSVFFLYLARPAR